MQNGNRRIKRKTKEVVPKGYKRRLEGDTSQGQLIIEIIENHGKAEAVCEATGLPYPMIAYWRTKGYVPIQRVGEVSRALGENIYALNYEEVTRLLGEAPPWREVVRGCNLSESRQKAVLQRPHPPTPKELL